MKKYTEPILTLLLFDEEEIITASYTYAARELNNVLMSDSVGMQKTTTITIEKVTVSN